MSPPSGAQDASRLPTGYAVGSIMAPALRARFWEKRNTLI